MSAHKHTPGTPGKWFVGQKVRDGSICVVGDIDSVVCEFGERLGGVEADARLIAAAPELLDLARLICRAIDEGLVINSSHEDSAGVLFDAAQEVISKATGEPA